MAFLPYEIWPLFAVVALLAGAVLSTQRPLKDAVRVAQLATAGAAGLALFGVLSLAAGIGPDGAGALGFLKFDALSATLLLMITVLGFVVTRYSATYLAGDPHQQTFLRKLCLTLAAVSTLITAGDLIVLVAAWITTSLALHGLLLFRPERPKAVIAARKKFIVARLGDAALVLAAIMMGSAFGTTNISTILDTAAQGGLSGDGVGVATGATGAAGFLVLAALLKSAQFPSHGWLAEVMETPTPVSALLHAGIVNAGGFLIIRFADVMLLNPAALHALALIGGFTALFGSIVMLTQTSVKVSLAYSTVAQMGFMLLQCGLGAFSAATLHIVAHSLYKAHAFLASGRALTQTSVRKPLEAATRRHVLLSVASATVIYAITAQFFDGAAKTPAIFALGAIFVVGLSLYLTGIFKAARGLTFGGAVAVLASLSYFTLQNVTAAVLAEVVPTAATTGPFGYVVITLAVLSFGGVALAQALPLKVSRQIHEYVYVLSARGFYANAYFNKMIGALRLSRQAASSR